MSVSKRAAVSFAVGAFVGWLLFSAIPLSTQKHIKRLESDRGMIVDAYFEKTGFIAILWDRGHLRLHVSRKDKSEFDLLGKFSYDWLQDIDLVVIKKDDGKYVLHERWSGVAWLIEDR